MRGILLYCCVICCVSILLYCFDDIPPFNGERGILLAFLFGWHTFSNTTSFGFVYIGWIFSDIVYKKNILV
jgi:hypothetical protein